MRIWAVVLAVGLGSYVLRVVPLLVAGRVTPSPRIERGLAHAGTAALTALVVGGLTSAGSWSDVTPVIAALAVGAVLAMRGSSMLRVVAAGVAVHAIVAAALPHL